MIIMIIIIIIIIIIIKLYSTITNSTLLLPLLQLPDLHYHFQLY